MNTAIKNSSIAQNQLGMILFNIKKQDEIKVLLGSYLDPFLLAKVESCYVKNNTLILMSGIFFTSSIADILGLNKEDILSGLRKLGITKVTRLKSTVFFDETSAVKLSDYNKKSYVRKHTSKGVLNLMKNSASNMEQSRLKDSLNSLCSAIERKNRALLAS